MRKTPLALPGIVKVAAPGRGMPVDAKLRHARRPLPAPVVGIDVLGVVIGEPNGAIGAALDAGDGALTIRGHGIGGRESGKEKGESWKTHRDGAVRMSVVLASWTKANGLGRSVWAQLSSATVADWEVTEVATTCTRAWSRSITELQNIAPQAISTLSKVIGNMKPGISPSDCFGRQTSALRGS